MTFTHPFSRLGPDQVLAAIESTGLPCDGRLQALNSYENRVYQAGLDGGDAGAETVVAKFYRPGRWSEAQIREEHAFLYELVAAELPVVPPLTADDGESLHRYDPFLFAVFPRRGGRLPELDFDTLHAVGRTLGKLHAVGSVRGFTARPVLSPASHGDASRHFLLEHDFLPPELCRAYETLTADLLGRIGDLWRQCSHLPRIRLHGDCHAGNILWRDGPLLVDFDDCLSGPAMQDLWMLLSGEREQQQAQLAELVDGYNTFHDFNPASLALVEVL
ncbi:MAG TPA: serine/threonine protein kinase, partial [Candidatus Acidoferrum sp.]|nr:serine/threonine protein kinase [Candidatus Acidoferrum sp.]